MRLLLPQISFFPASNKISTNGKLYLDDSHAMFVIRNVYILHLCGYSRPSLLPLASYTGPVYTVLQCTTLEGLYSDSQHKINRCPLQFKFHQTDDSTIIKITSYGIGEKETLAYIFDGVQFCVHQLRNQLRIDQTQESYWCISLPSCKQAGQLKVIEVTGSQWTSSPRYDVHILREVMYAECMKYHCQKTNVM